MTPERAREILQMGAQWSEYRKHMTPEEIAYVTDGWKRMPGTTCFHDALVRVARQVPPFNMNVSDDQLTEYWREVNAASDKRCGIFNCDNPEHKMR